MKKQVESVWKPVTLTNGRRGNNTEAYKISSYSISSGWYNNIIANDGSRLTKLRNYHEADSSSVEISRALDILAEDISSCNADNDQIFYMEFCEKGSTKKSTITISNEALRMWLSRTEFEDRLFDRVRKTLKYGATYYKRNVDGSLTEILPERLVGYILSHENEDTVTHYIYDPKIPRIDECGRSFDSRTSKSSEYEQISVDDMVVLKLGDTPFGESIIQRVYGLWKIMKMIEDSVVIYRVTRSHERRVYYIDVGNLQGAKREAAIERQRMRLSQRQTSKGGQLTTEYDPHSVGEDIFIPTNSTGKGSRVETLQSGMNLGELSDLEWFRKKLAAGLRIPSSMLDTQEQGQPNQHSDMRVGQLYQIEMRYMGYVKRIKRQLLPNLDKDFRTFSKEREIVIPITATLNITDSMSFAEYKDIELQQSLLNVVNSSLQLDSISKRYALKTYMQMSTEDLMENEESVLRIRGIDPAVIKKLPQHVIENIVYGKGELGKEFGIEQQEDEGY